MPRVKQPTAADIIQLHREARDLVAAATTTLACPREVLAMPRAVPRQPASPPPPAAGWPPPPIVNLAATPAAEGSKTA